MFLIECILEIPLFATLFGMPQSGETVSPFGHPERREGSSSGKQNQVFKSLNCIITHQIK